MKKIITYNVNGIRAAMAKNLSEWISGVAPDVLCLQESKAHSDQLDKEIKELEDLGYSHYWHSAEKKGYSGVSIISKEKPIRLKYGCDIAHIDSEGRVLQADFENFSVISVYVPSASNMDRLDFKMEFCRDFSNYIANVLLTHPNLVICGDFNISHEPIDIHDPVRLKTVSGFLPMEREWLTEFLVENKLADPYRYLHPETQEFTWWSYRAGARAKNKGWRLDYHYVSQPLQHAISECNILGEAIHSDHCPVELVLNIK